MRSYKFQTENNFVSDNNTLPGCVSLYLLHTYYILYISSFSFMGISQSIWYWIIISSNMSSWYESVICIGNICSAFLPFLLQIIFRISAISFKIVLSRHRYTIVCVRKIKIFWCGSCSKYYFVSDNISLRYVSRTANFLYSLTWLSIVVSYCDANVLDTYVIM